MSLRHIYRNTEQAHPLDCCLQPTDSAWFSLAKVFTSDDLPQTLPAFIPALGWQKEERPLEVWFSVWPGHRIEMYMPIYLKSSLVVLEYSRKWMLQEYDTYACFISTIFSRNTWMDWSLVLCSISYSMFFFCHADTSLLLRGTLVLASNISVFVKGLHEMKISHSSLLSVRQSKYEWF